MNEIVKYFIKVTFPLFILFSAMLTATQYFGNPIDCMVQGVPASIVNTYCWTHGTYTIKDLEHFTVNFSILSNFVNFLYFNREESQLRRRESTCGSMITQA